MGTIKEILAQVFKQLPSSLYRLPAEWRRDRFRQKLKRRFLANDSDQLSRTKVFGIGLSRTGTTSLAHALQILGYRSFHWSRNGKVLGWPDFQDAEAATDTPCSSQFEALYHTFDESKFIYTTRAVERWKTSIKKYLDVQTPSELRELPTKATYWQSDNNWATYNNIRRVQIHECLYTQHDSWEAAYWSFDNRVRRFFEDKPDHRFLEMNITDGEGWDVLCPFLNLTPPDCPFPHRSTFRSDSLRS